MLGRQFGLLACVLAAGASPATAISGPQVLSRCEKAYRAIRSYQGTTQISSRSSRPGGPVQVMSTHARIRYARPGKIRVEGTFPSFPGSKETVPCTFTIASNGIQTSERWTVEGNVWKKSDSVEDAVATFTGVSLGACTTIPALLFSMEWGRLWSPKTQVQQAVTIERVQGVKAYRVDFSGRFSKTTVWIDTRTFLLLKLRELRDDDKLVAAMSPEHKAVMEKALADIPEDERKAILESDAKERKLGPETTITTESFTNVRTTGTIPATVFEAIDLPNA